VVNGGYVDDLDFGTELVYTGAGGNDTGTRKQIGDQSLEHRPNAALVTSEQLALCVRVIRGFRGDPAFSPSSGYRYDGLFQVTEHWLETGRDGFKICRFRLVEKAI
jgi:putative restriction endonuclease